MKEKGVFDMVATTLKFPEGHNMHVMEKLWHTTVMGNFAASRRNNCENCGTVICAPGTSSYSNLDRKRQNKIAESDGKKKLICFFLLKKKYILSNKNIFF